MVIAVIPIVLMPFATIRRVLSVDLSVYFVGIQQIQFFGLLSTSNPRSVNSLLPQKYLPIFLHIPYCINISLLQRPFSDRLSTC
jgi:hypothetical protein